MGVGRHPCNKHLKKKKNPHGFDVDHQVDLTVLLKKIFIIKLSRAGSIFNDGWTISVPRG